MRFSPGCSCCDGGLGDSCPCTTEGVPDNPFCVSFPSVIDAADCDCSPFTGELELVFADLPSCTWTHVFIIDCPIPGQVDIALQYRSDLGAGVWLLEITIDVSIGPTYIIENWDCSTTGIFDLVDSGDETICANWPATISVIPGAC
jgi:hypothetical protein